MASMVNSGGDACSSSSTPSSASSSSLKKAGRRLTRNGMSLKRISVSSLTEARAATKSALRAGKYRVKETSRDLWSKTKVPLARGKRKSKELVDLSADLISSLSIRVQEKLNHNRHHQQQHYFNPHQDTSESDHEYCWESDFSDASLSDSSTDDEEVEEEEEAIINSTSDGRRRQDYYDRGGKNEESDCVLADEVAGDCIRSEHAVECKSIRKIEDTDQYRPVVSHVPSIEQIRQQLFKIQQNSNKRRQPASSGSDCNQAPDQVHPNPCLKVNPKTVNTSCELPHSTNASELLPKNSSIAPPAVDQQNTNTIRKVAVRAQRPREQPPPPPPPHTLPPSLLSSTSSLNSAPLSLSSTSSSTASSSQSSSSQGTETSATARLTDNPQHNDVNGIIKDTNPSNGNDHDNGYEREFNCLKRNTDRETPADDDTSSAAVPQADQEEDCDTDTDSESSYEVPVDSCPWFRPDLTRSEAEEYLMSQESLGDGNFVIRPGGSPLYPFSLSLLHEKRVYHLNIRSDAGSSSYSLGKGSSGRVFPDLKHLVVYYASKPLMLVSSKYKPAPNQNNNHHSDLPPEPRKYVRLSVIS